jgi:hypothetical protein
LAYPLAVAVLLLAWRRTKSSGRIVAAILAVMWGWVGIVYHGVFFGQINPVAQGFAAAFVVQACLFGFNAAVHDGTEFGHRSRVRAAVGAIMMGYALVAYPVIGLAAGDTYPAMPLFGVAPCPLLVFTLGLMLWASCVRWWLWVVPMLWSVVGGTGALLLSVPQDWALPISAVVALILLLTDRPQRVPAPEGFKADATS